MACIIAIGGCASFTESTAQIARDLGVRISLNDDVQEILFRASEVGLQSRSGIHDADTLMINADFARATTPLVPDPLRLRWSNRKLTGKRFSCSTFMLHLGIEGRYDHLAHHTIYRAEDYVRNLQEIEARQVLSEDPSFYVQNACASDPKLAPPGCSALYVLLPVTHQHPNINSSRAAFGLRLNGRRSLNRRTNRRRRNWPWSRLDARRLSSRP